jgi:hypothetical protein
MASIPNDGPPPPVRPQPGRPGIDPDLHDVGQLIHEEFDDRLGTRVVQVCLEQVAARFASAPIRTFVPLLVRRYVREELQARHRAITRSSTPTLADTSPPAMRL